jgi:hypothetical protein
MNVGLKMMMMVVVEVVMVNNYETDYHYGNFDDDHDPDHDLVLDLHHVPDLLNVDFVVDIVLLLHDDHKSIDPNNDKTHDEDNTDKEVSF